MQAFLRGLAPLSLCALLSACGAVEPPGGASPSPVAWVVAPPSAAQGEPAGFVVELPGFPDDLALVRAAAFIEQSGGKATLQAVLASRRHPGQRWRLDLDFVGLIEPERPCQVRRGPDGDLLGYPEAWASGLCEGWSGRGYALASGELTGLDDCQGARIRLLGDYPALRLREDLRAPGRAPAAACSLELEIESQPRNGPGLARADERGLLRFRLAGPGPGAASTRAGRSTPELVARAHGAQPIR